MTRPRLRVIQGGAAPTPDSPAPAKAPAASERVTPPRPAKPAMLSEPVRRFDPSPQPRRAAVRLAGPTRLTWFFAVLGLGGAAFAFAGQPLLGCAMVLAAAGGMVAPPGRTLTGRQRLTGLSLVAGASALAAADIAISLLG